MVVAISLLVASMLLTVVMFILLETIGLLDAAESNSNDRELFSRIFLFFLLSFSCFPLVFSKKLRDRVRRERWILILVTLFALGSLFAIGDPLNYVNSEENWIRYWTAGALVAAGAMSVVSSLSAVHRPVDRLFGLSFGLLLIAAAGDELFQLHENLGSKYRDSLPSPAGTTVQDLLTLGVAGLGVVAIAMVVLIWRFAPQRMNFISEQRYRRTFLFFVLAVLTFASAMMLDTFDWVLEDLADQVRTAVSGSSDPSDLPLWLAVSNFARLANSLEELLEYLAALFFLMMMGTLFSIKALGLHPCPSLDGRSEVSDVAPQKNQLGLE